MEEYKKPYISLNKTIQFILANVVKDKICDKVGIFRYGGDYKCYYCVYGTWKDDPSNPIIFFVIESISQEIVEFHYGAFKCHRKFRHLKQHWLDKDKFKIDIVFKEEKDKLK